MKKPYESVAVKIVRINRCGVLTDSDDPIRMPEDDFEDEEEKTEP